MSTERHIVTNTPESHQIQETGETQKQPAVDLMPLVLSWTFETPAEKSIITALAYFYPHAATIEQIQALTKLTRSARPLLNRLNSKGLVKFIRRPLKLGLRDGKRWYYQYVDSTGRHRCFTSTGERDEAERRLLEILNDSPRRQDVKSANFRYALDLGPAASHINPIPEYNRALIERVSKWKLNRSESALVQALAYYAKPPNDECAIAYDDLARHIGIGVSALVH